MLKAKHVIAVLPLEALFLSINYNATIASGEPLYWFLDWQDYKTAFVIAILNCVFIGGFVVLAKVTVWLKPRKVFKMIEGALYQIRRRRGM